MTRQDLINYCLRVIRRRDPSILNAVYLSIGVDDPSNTFNDVEAEIRVGVDPYQDDTQCHKWAESNREAYVNAVQGILNRITSDEFFEDRVEALTECPPHLIFLDGLHTEEQLDRDIENSLKYLQPGSIIIVDDVLPHLHKHTIVPPEPRSHWHGTCYKSFWKIREREDLISGVIQEAGCGFIYLGSRKPTKVPDVRTMTDQEAWDHYIVYRHNLLNVINFKTFTQDYWN